MSNWSNTDPHTVEELESIVKDPRYMELINKYIGLSHGRITFDIHVAAEVFAEYSSCNESPRFQIECTTYSVLYRKLPKQFVIEFNKVFD